MFWILSLLTIYSINVSSGLSAAATGEKVVFLAMKRLSLEGVFLTLKVLYEHDLQFHSKDLFFSADSIFAFVWCLFCYLINYLHRSKELKIINTKKLFAT